MNNKEETINFLETLSKMCDDKATIMVKLTKKKSVEEGIDALVYSTMIMNIFTNCKSMIEKLSHK